MSDYRVSVKVRNNNLLKAIEMAGHSPGSKFSAKVGVSYGITNDYINLKRSPIDSEGNLRVDAEKIAIFLNTPPFELWSSEQLTAIDTNISDIEASYKDMIRYRLGRPVETESADPYELIEENETKELLDSAINKLCKRDSYVLKKRFGLEGNKTTLDEIGSDLGVGGNRVRQIENDAIRKLSDPWKNAELRADLGVD